MRMKAIWNDRVIAESDDIVIVEGNHYFPSTSIASELFDASDTQSVCSWKGTAHYYNIIVEGNTNADAAWYYPETKKAADNIRGRIAFWRGVEIRE